MRILNIIQCTNLGGMEQAALLRLAGMRDLGHSCRMLSLNPLGDLKPHIEREGFRCEGVPYAGRWGWRSAPRVYARIRSVATDAIVMTGHHLLTQIMLGDYCRGARVLDLHYYHGGKEAKGRTAWRLIYEVAVRQFDALTFPSDFVRREAETILPAVAKISHTLRNPFKIPEIPTSDVKAEARANLGLPEGLPLIGNAGWLIPSKRFDVFIRVAARVAQETRDAHFVIAGDGVERENLAALAADLRIEDRIHWLGWQADLTTFYSSIDMLLFNSDWDAMPRTPQEALTFGLPVVASVQRGGLSEILKDGVNGFLICTHDIPRLAEAVKWVLDHPGEAKLQALRGRRLLEECSSVRSIAGTMLKLLNRDRGV